MNKTFINANTTFAVYFCDKIHMETGGGGMPFTQFETLSIKKRFGLVQEEHPGIIVKCDTNKVLDMIGNGNDFRVYWRSCMKPLQLAAVYDVLEYFDFTPEETVLACASHTGSAEHLEIVRGILKKAGFSERDLLCPAADPIDEFENIRLVQKNLPPMRIHNNCSGKHATMLAYCRMHNIDPKNYILPTHPLNVHVIGKVLELAGLTENEVTMGIDGCLLPVVGAPLKNLAFASLKVLCDKKYQKIVDSIALHPHLLGGHGRADSEIIRLSGGKLIAKNGAGNITILLNRVDETCTVIKVANTEESARNYILTKLAEETGLMSEEISDNFNTAEEQFETTFSLAPALARA